MAEPKRAGRKAGVPNKKTAEFLQRVLGSGKSPLEILIEFAREKAPAKPKKLSDDAANERAIVKWEKEMLEWRTRVIEAAGKAAPYCHPKLMAQVNPADWDKPPVQRVEVTFV